MLDDKVNISPWSLENNHPPSTLKNSLTATIPPVTLSQSLRRRKEMGSRWKRGIKVLTTFQKDNCYGLFKEFPPLNMHFEIGENIYLLWKQKEHLRGTWFQPLVKAQQQVVTWWKRRNLRTPPRRNSFLWKHLDLILNIWAIFFFLILFNFFFFFNLSQNFLMPPHMTDNTFKIFLK